MVGHGAVLAGCVKVKGEGKGILVDLLSDRARVMGCVHLEGAVVCPEVDRVGNAGASPLKDLLRLLAMRVANDWRPRLKGRTISADSGPAMLNSVSAYFFQYPNKSGNFARKRS
jgi:hypothetical protein